MFIIMDYIIVLQCFRDPAGFQLESNSVNGIEWFAGNVPHRKLYSNLRDIAKTARTIYSYEESCVRLLESIATRKIINLDELGYTPSTHETAGKKIFCYHHGVLQQEKFSCALTVAQDMKNWLLTKIELPVTDCRELNIDNNLTQEVLAQSYAESHIESNPKNICNNYSASWAHILFILRRVDKLRAT